MLHAGDNFIDGIPVVVERKRIRRINLHVDAQGRVRLSIPLRGATLAEGNVFLRANWKWCVAARAKALARSSSSRLPPDESQVAALRAALADLHAVWTLRLGEAGVTWKLRRMKSLWGSCHWRRRQITYNSELARTPLELVEYVVVHELTHLQVHDHGPAFRALMDARLPDWPLRRRRLNGKKEKNG